MYFFGKVVMEGLDSVSGGVMTVCFSLFFSYIYIFFFRALGSVCCCFLWHTFIAERAAMGLQMTNFFPLFGCLDKRAGDLDNDFDGSGDFGFWFNF
jgi:hypothetical protein